MDKKRESATRYVEVEKVVETYEKIKNIISANSRLPFKDVISDIAGIKIGTYYNYIYKGRHQGQVSKYTVEKLSQYFDIPEKVFECKMELTPDYEDKIAERILKQFGGNEQDSGIKKPGRSNTKFSPILKNLTRLIIMENNISTLNDVISQMDNVRNVAANRIKALTLYSEL